MQESVHVASDVCAAQEDASKGTAADCGPDSIPDKWWESGDARGGYHSGWNTVQFAGDLSVGGTHHSGRSRYAVQVHCYH